jgi:DNA-dependent protein kinase catalytic subunit
MIDFGYSFCAGIELPIPELIPFRLTRSLRDLAAPLGIDGSFRKCMLACFEALNKKMHLIVDYCDVFVDDPLMEWVWVSRRQLGQAAPAQNHPQTISSGGQSFSVSQETSEKKLFSNKIKVVENKLRGHNPRLILETLLTDSRHKSTPYFDSLKKAIWGKAKYKGDILSGENLVNELITLATDRNVTGRSYIGLNLFV